MRPHIRATVEKEDASGQRTGRSSASSIRLVLRAVQAPERDRRFLFRRAADEIRQHSAEPEASYLRRVLESYESDRASRSDVLLELAGYLESRGRLEEASEVLELAMALDPEDAEFLLHAARVARKSGSGRRARVLYQEVIRAARENGHLCRMAEIGLSLLDPDPESALGREIRRALAEGDNVAAAVAQEERARARRDRGDVAGAIRDYAVAAVRFADPADLGRIGHEATDMLMLGGDLMGARGALLEVERRALPRQSDRARARLLEVSRALGDELGARRWAESSARPSLVSLSTSARAGSRPGPVMRLEDWIRRLRSLERTGS